MKKVLLFLFGLNFALLLNAQVYKTISCAAGKLSTLITNDELGKITNLTITGTMDARDFYFIRDNASRLANLDLGLVEIKSYSTNSQNYPSDAIPDGALESFRGTSFSIIKLPNTLKSIGKKAFQSCRQLDNIVLPETVTIIDDYAFYGCSNLKSINFPLSLTSIGIAAFYSCSFTSIDLKSTLTTIKHSAFLYCGKLAKVEIANIDTIEDQAFSLCFSLVSFSANSMKTMGDNVFKDCYNLTNLALPNSLASIGKGTFVNCSNLKSINLPTAITYLPAETFMKCTGLTSIVLPSSIKGIGKAAFSDCSNLSEVTIPTSMETIEDHTFYYCSKLTNFILPQSVKTIGNAAFGFCSIKQISFPSTLEAVKDSAFYRSALVNIAFQSANCSIGKYVFANCTMLSSCQLPASLVNVPANTFRGCSSLSSITLPETITSVDNGAFKGCTNLKINSLPSGLISIGSDSFSDCSNISIQSLPNTLITIGSRAFNGCSKITLSTLPSSLTRIEASTFSSCIGIQSFKVPNSVTYIGDSAFFQLSNLSSIDLPQSVTSIGQYAFMFCKKLTSIIIPPITELKEGTFNSCDLLKSVQLPENLFSIRKEAFNYCRQLSSITLPATLSSIGQSAFVGCYSLTEMKVLSLTPPKTTYLSLGSGSTESLRKVFVPYGTSYLYKAADNWKNFKNIIEIPSITLSAYFIDLPEKEGSDSTIQVFSTTNWTASCDQPWLQIKSAEGVGNGKLNFTFLPNASLTKRTANITIAALGLTPQILQVKQAPETAKIELSLTKDTIEINADNGNSTKIIVTSNTSWSAVSNETWLKVDPVSTTNGNGTLTITATENQTAKYRIATVTITGEKAQPKMITVVQNDSSNFNKLASFPERVTLPAKSSGSTFIQIFSNLKWSAFTTNNWISLSSDTIVGNGQLEILVNDNRDTYQRSGVVYINASGMPPLAVQVVQEAAKPFFTLSKTSIELNFDNGSNDSIFIDTNVSWSAISNQSWLTIAPTNYQNGNKLVLKTTENIGAYSRQAIITISAYSISPSQKIIVYQKSKVIAKTITITAGTLSKSLSNTEKQTITDLSILGTMDARDFRILRDSIPNLERINLREATIQAYSGIYGTDGYLYQTTYTANTVPKHSFNRYNYLEGPQIRSVVLPSNCTSIESFAFNNCIRLSTIEMPASVSFIGMRAFFNCKELTDFTFPSSLTSIGEEAFWGCSQLTDIAIPSLVKSLGNDAFSDCSNLQRVQLLGQLTIIPQRAFKRCSNLNSINITQSVYSIAEEAFSGCENLTNIDIPNSVKTIGLSAFSGCYKLNNIKLPGSVTTIDGGSFSNCRSLTSIEIPSSIRLISHYLFNGCTMLESVSLPNSIIEIGQEVFTGCEKLTSITIPSSVKKIGRASFRDCSNLKEVYALPAIPVDLSGLGGVFENVNKNTCILYVAEGSKQLYQNAYEWKDFKNIQEINKLSLSAMSLTLRAAEGSRDSVFVTSSLMWKAVSDQNWLTVNPSTAIGGKKAMVLIASANPNPTLRSATVTVSGVGIESQFITVKQVAGDSIFTVSETSLSYSNMLEKRKIKITSNSKWTATSDQGWLTVNPISGLSSDSITITAQKNEGALRTGIVTVSTTGFDPKLIKVTQAAVNTLKIDSPTYLNLGELAESRTINVTSNLNWTVDSDQEWLIVSPATGSKNGSFTISSKTNIVYSRMAYVTISASGLKPIVISVNQSAAKVILQVSGNALKIPSEEYHYSYFSIKSNTNWTASSDQSWLKVSPTSGNGNKSLDIMAEANTSFTLRKATITVAVNDTVKQLINVTQEATVRKLAVSQNKIILEQTDNSKSSVSILANLPWTITSDQNWLSINTISGDGNQTVTFSASENTNFGSRTAVVTISAEGVHDQIISVIQLSLPGRPDLIVKRSNTAPKVDGIIDANDPWSTQWIPMSTPCWRNTTSAMNAKFQILAGDDAFYIGVIIEDTTRYTYNSVLLNSYDKDCSEIFISMDTIPSNINVLGTAGNWLLRTHRDGEPLVESNNIAALLTDPKFSVTSKTSDKEYTQEIILPYSTLIEGMANEWDKKNFRLDIAASDNTTGNSDGRTQQQFWNSGTDEQWRNTQYYGKAQIEAVGSYLDINKTAIELMYDDSIASFTIESSVSWTIKSDQNWLTVSPTEGFNNRTINLSSTTNLGESRTATLTISALGLPNKTIHVKQAGAPIFLSVSSSELELKNGEENASIEVKSNSKWTASSNQTWLKVSPETSEGDGLIVLKSERNQAIEPRTAIVKVLCNGLNEQYINIKQLGQANYIMVSDSTILFTSNGGVKLVDIISDQTWMASSNQNWLKIDKENTIKGNSTITLTATMNNTKNERIANVTIISKSAIKTISISQDPNLENGTKELKQGNFLLFPNPTSNIFCITGLNGIATLQITDINGKVLLEKQIINSELIPVGSLLKGVYYVQIITPNKSFGQRLVKL